MDVDTDSSDIAVGEPNGAVIDISSSEQDSKENIPRIPLKLIFSALVVGILKQIRTNTQSSEEDRFGSGTDQGSESGSSTSTVTSSENGTEGTRSPGTSNGTSTTCASVPNLGSKTQTTSRKRKRNKDVDGNESDDDNHLPRRKKINSIEELLRGKFFACPFAKGFPNDHLQCWVIYRRDIVGIR